MSINFYGQLLDEKLSKKFLWLVLLCPTVEREVDEAIKGWVFASEDVKQAKERYLFGLFVIEHTLRCWGKLQAIVNTVKERGYMQSQDLRALFSLGINLVNELTEATGCRIAQQFLNKMLDKEVKSSHLKQAISEWWKNK